MSVILLVYRDNSVIREQGSASAYLHLRERSVSAAPVYMENYPIVRPVESVLTVGNASLGILKVSIFVAFNVR